MTAAPEIEAAIRTRLADLGAAFVDGDVDRWMQLVVPEDLCWIATGPEEYAIGRDQIRDLIARSLVGSYDRSFEFGPNHISAQGTVAWVTGKATIAAHAAGRHITLPYRYTGVFVQRNGQWLIANFHQSVGDPRQAGETWDTMLDTVASEVRREQPDLGRRIAPDGTLALMFSDIEDSTGLTERLGDLRWIEVLREHNTIVRERVQAHAGFEVKTIGDAFMIVFPSARRALLCAIDLQRAFSAYAREHPEEPVRVRFGLHVGEPIREAGDFFGKSVIFASRVAAQANGGEILVSALLKELVESAGDIEFDVPRELALKGFDGTHSLYPVRWH